MAAPNKGHLGTLQLILSCLLFEAKTNILVNNGAEPSKRCPYSEGLSEVNSLLVIPGL